MMTTSMTLVTRISYDNDEDDYNKDHDKSNDHVEK
jgi:hypothetical protein